MNLALVFIIGLISFVPLIYFPNPGYDALLIPFNIFMWEIAAASIFFAGFYAFKHRIIWTPKHGLWLLALPAGIILSGFVTGIVRPVDWMFRLCGILMGLLFFFSLFQFRVNRRTLDNAIYIILASMMTNAIISFLQLFPGRTLFGLIPHPAVPQAVGVFMQPNILASAMVTGVLLGIYQVSSPGFAYRGLLIKTLCYAALFSTTAIVLASGSRIGLLTLIIALPIMLASRHKQLSQKRPLASIAFLMVIAGCSTGLMISDGSLKAYSKLERLAEQGTEARVHLYRIGWDIFTDAPLFGHGIGSFQSTFHEKAAEYMEARGGVPLIGDARFTHPHNEMLFWAIEGGSIAVAGILIAATIFLFQAHRLGRERGLALLALLIPISLHTQTELPFYSSVYHWLLFSFLAYMLFLPLCMRHRFKKQNPKLIAVPATGSAVLIATLFFGVSTFSASRDITRLLLYKEINLSDLRAAQDNLYFNELATQLSLKVLLNQDLTHNTYHWTQTYIDWTEDFIKKVPDISSFHDLALAYNHLGMHSKASDIIKRGLYLFPRNPVISGTVEKLKNSQSSPPQAFQLDSEKKNRGFTTLPN